MSGIFIMNLPDGKQVLGKFRTAELETSYDDWGAELSVRLNARGVEMTVYDPSPPKNE